MLNKKRKPEGLMDYRQGVESRKDGTPALRQTPDGTLKG